MKGLIGKKLGMTQVFGPDGEAVPVTVLEVENNKVLQVKTTQRDGYEAIQVGYGRKKLHRATKANRARAEAAGLDSAPLRIREFRTPDASHFKVGDEIAVDFFRPGDRVKVRGTSKGRGFAGAMKRHGFSGGTRKSHGGGPSHRGVGSVGMSADPARTPKGRKLAGQYGNQRVTAMNLLVVDVDPEEELLIVRGAVPGPMNGLVTIELIGEVPRVYAAGGAADEQPAELSEEVTDELPEEAPVKSGEEIPEEGPAESPEESLEESPGESPENEISEMEPEEEAPAGDAETDSAEEAIEEGSEEDKSEQAADG